MQPGIIFDVKQYALHDGPGIRTTVFLKGCPLSCQWCHNPEGIAMDPQVLYQKRRCAGCGECLDACPERALSITTEGVVTEEGLCKKDGVCADVCPSEAREMIGKLFSPQEIVDIVKRDIPFYRQSGGGVTFSGGEPLTQPEFLLECLKCCGREGIHRTVDTSGFAEPESIKRVAVETDLFLYDLKFMDSEKHRYFTGVSNQLILANLKYLARSGTPVVVRFPLIPGINDDDDNIDLMGMFLRVLPEIESMHILPYHGYQENKYGRLNTVYMAKNIIRPSLDDLSRTKKRLESFGLKVEIGG